METRIDNTLENLDEKKRQWILELASQARQIDVVIALKKEGIEVSVSTLSRFLRRERERRLLEDGQEISETTTALAERAKTGKLREGTIEALRQRLYERALCSQSPEEARELFGAVVKEEVRLRELELEARKVAIAEAELKMQRVKMRIDAGRRSTKRVKAEVVDSETVVDSVVHENVPAQLVEKNGEVNRLRNALKEVEGILNRGGDGMERILLAREKAAAVLAGGVIDDRE